MNVNPYFCGMKTVRQILGVILFLSLSFSCATDRLKGTVVKIQDGDTITLLASGKKEVKIRLHGIDAPENGQDFSRKSGEYLSDLVAGKNVTVVEMGKDQYKRILGVVYVKELNVNEEMIRSGLAWRYKYNKDPKYLELQEKARKKKLNIWSVKNPVDPWQWRKDQKEHSRKKKS